jgi:hypothetical protein
MKRCNCTASQPLQQMHCSATVFRSFAQAWRRAGNNVERTLIQAKAEDAPARTALQAAWAAPMERV